MSSKVETSKPHKRKRDGDGNHTTTSTPMKKHKNRESLMGTSATDDGSAKKRKKTTDTFQSDDAGVGRRKEKVLSDSEAKTAPPTNLRASGTGKIAKENSKAEGHDSEDGQSMEEVSSTREDRKPSKAKHAGILSKFERTKTAATAKSKKNIPEVVEQSNQNIPEPVIAKGLEPLPQPENPPEIFEAPAYSSLPPWLANPLRTSAKERARFSDLGIKPDLLRILAQNNYHEAFAVQSTVIPLLLDGTSNHPGDLCVSAATGSGKTLSYVLPLVTSLASRPASRLRGLIVVPTRELVKQAREACELCASGSRLHIGSAVGNVAIKEEQKLLMRVDQVYNPATVDERQKTGLQQNDWMDLNLEDCVAEATESTGFLPGYIQQAEPNIDILICTPGRLVDHIRYTKGFTLKHLEWLVIDEADRLLNESFQEWVDVVIGSLNARRAPETFGPAGKLLSDLGLAIDTHPPRKVILSATMTQDITKLNSLQLANPKMVIIGSEKAVESDDPSTTQHDTHFTLPPTLQEHIVTVGDGAQKPLYLLRLLLSHIKVDVDSCTNSARIVDSTNTSDDETSSDESSDDDTSSSGSDSDSDSDSSSDSDSESDSSTNSSSESSSDELSESESKSPELVSRNGPSRETVLIFTKSSESASRLSRLISILHPQLANRVGTIIKSNKSSTSRKTLSAYRRGRISVIVATDRASRGLDLHSLTHVVNYDIPPSVTTYVHRVGRTARAGRNGSAWTLVAHREGRWFSNEIAADVNGPITRTTSIDRVQIKSDSLKVLEHKYSQALDALEKEVRTGRPRQT
ncbi:hypothetical protein N7462_006166 [Penicillium macrosclerotiorum]|uniref:uncharacterized protein n=1 Tax=Penicillium macrosclerotiorum TaxID=303699 RepID=UPI00254708FD|nr:uncharacterized protein N7462_006166 [Penicillium macrosclerotiorum]KAJ5683001.1 hypothetical protein N7462_006166 [Penicillium macrosclerotiorum]